MKRAPAHPLLAALIWSLITLSQCQGAVVITQFFFDDFRDSFNTSSLTPPSKNAGLVETSTAVPFRTLTDTITTPDSAGAKRTLSMSISPINNIGDITAFIDNTGFNPAKPDHFSIGADTETAGQVILDYDFTPIGSIDPGAFNTHVELQLLQADNKQVSGSLEFRDIHGALQRFDLINDLGVNMRRSGNYLIPFSTFSNVDFLAITGLRLEINPGPSYDVEIAYVAGALEVPAIPEPSAILLVGIASFCLLTRRSRIH